MTNDEILRLLLEKVGTIGTDITGMKADIGELKADVAILKADVEELKFDVAILKADVGELKSDVAILKADVVDLKANVRRLNRNDELILDEVERVHELFNRHKDDKNKHTA